ncbi:hypothetical protein [Candidatus Sororendozoicomonas aggregata]|uniref:hypothetical protein n=1 Tax=Candidatus Sororendozoicomonas aggregata TaxID=3073239 RepID=UPI002ED5E1C3
MIRFFDSFPLIRLILAIETGLNELRALSQYLKEHAAQLKRLEETLEEEDI